MKQNKTKLYARALAEILSKKGGVSATEEKRVVSNFVKLIIAAGLEKKLKEILSLAEDFILANQGKRRITFETARTTTASQKKILDGIVNKGDIVKEKISPELIAGIKIIINDSKQLDLSLLAKLQEVFT